MMKKFASIRKSFAELYAVFFAELRRVKADSGILIFFLLVPLAYPLLYGSIYNEETVHEVPVVVVDADHTSRSRDYLRRVDASPDVKVVAQCSNMEDAKEMLRRREAYGVIFVPENFHHDLTRGKQVHVNIFADMSSLLYYKALLMANTAVSLQMNADIKVLRAGNTTAVQDAVTEHPISYAEVSLYNPQNGFAAFLIPAVLVLILQQTLLLGVAMAAGTERDPNRLLSSLRFTPSAGTFSTLLGKASAHLLVYIPVTVYLLGVVPRIFRLNQIGNPWDIACFMLPFLLACAFFAQTVSALFRHRETCMLIIVFTSVPLLFLSGISWPGAAIPPFWKAVSYIFPSTFGVNGFVKINNMAAPLSALRPEVLMLWLQTFVYFLTASILTRRRQKGK